jgi:hypothetical protein
MVELGRYGAPASVPASAPVLAGYVEFGELGFEFRRPGINQGGVRAFLFLVFDENGRPSDIIAWAPLINRLAFWRGRTQMAEATRTRNSGPGISGDTCQENAV